MCGPIAEALKKKYPNFTSREWTIYLGVICVILGANLVNLIFNVFKYEAADANPVSSISQTKLPGQFPAFTVGMCALFGNQTEIVNVAADGLLGQDSIYPRNSTLGDNPCWLFDLPPIQFKYTIIDGEQFADGYDIWGIINITDPKANYSSTRQLITLFGLPPNTKDIPADFDIYDFDNIFTIIFSGYEADIPVTVEQINHYKGDTEYVFTMSPVRVLFDTVLLDAGGRFDVYVDAKGLNKMLTVSKEDTTFGLAALFAALLSIFNISLTVFALLFPTGPLVVSQTFFRFKEPALFDPSKLTGQAAEELLVSKSPKSKSRPASPTTPKDEPATKDEMVAMSPISSGSGLNDEATRS